MEKCFDIKNNEVSQFVLGDNGVVYGVTESGTKETLSYDCCLRMGYEFDSDMGLCYWSKPCDVDNEIKILISPEGEDGVIFQVDDNETCTLEVEFDYLFQFNCSDLLNCKTNLLESVDNKGVLEYELNSKSTLISDNDYRISILESDLKLFIFNTKNNINIIELKIEDLSNETYDTSQEINGYKKEIEQLNIFLNEKIASYTKEINLLKKENSILLKEVNNISKEITILNSTINEINMLNILTSPIVKVSIEKYDVSPLNELERNISFENEFSFSTVIESEIYQINDVVTFFSGNNSTGIYFIDDNEIYCDSLIDIIYQDLGNNSIYLNENSFKSNWLHYKLIINDPIILNEIKNKKIKLGIKIQNNPCEMSVLIDNIKFNRVCEVIEINKTVITENPSFNLIRVIDNKKSWVNNDNVVNRNFDLSLRETSYNIGHHKLGINTKEVDINISSAAAIESDVKDFILDNPTILGSLSGLITTNIFESGLTHEEFMSILYSELIDVKSRQVISNYPLLKMIYENYLNSLDVIGVKSSEFNYSDMSKFVKLIGDYWVDLVEQVIPSTTIWGATYKFNNTIFDNNKYKYKRGTLFTCVPKKTPLPIIGNANVEVIIEGNRPPSAPNIKVAYLGPTICENVYMLHNSDSSEFIGSVKVLGRIKAINLDEGDIIILNESENSVIQKI